MPVKRRSALQLAAATAAFTLVTGNRARGERAPNLLVICVDDLNHWVGHLGAPQRAITPWIDSLAARGTSFSHAYCPAPYCNASRMAVFSGMLPMSTGIYKDEPYWQRTQRPPTFFELARQHHYFLYGAGKVFHGRYDYPTAQTQGQSHAQWLDLQNRPALWDGYQPLAPEPLAQPFPSHGLATAQDGQPWSAQFDWGVLTPEQERQHPDVVTAQAVAAFLRQPTREPFLCVAGFYKPHLPWYAPQRWLDRYPLDQLVMPTVDARDLNDVPPLARQWALNPADQQTLEARQFTRQAVQAYKASISFADEQIGTVLQTLWTSPLRDNTIVALWSDNGFHLGEKLHWRKFTLWEEATRVPMIISAPQRGAYRSVVPSPVSVIDLFPTLFAMAGLPVPMGIDGQSLLPLMRSGDPGAAAPALMSWGEGNHSIRQHHWRYTRYSDQTEELYDLEADPLEHRNLAADPASAATLAQMRQTLQRLVRRK